MLTKNAILTTLKNTTKPLFGQDYNPQLKERISEFYGKHPALNTQGVNSYLRGVATRKYMVDKVVTLANEGVLTSFIWHYKHPITNSYYSEEKAPNANIAAIMPGGSHHQAFLDTLKTLGDYFLELKTAGIAFLLRPFHEMNGGWFWWGTKEFNQNTPEDFINLFRFVKKYFDDIGLDNILYVFSPNISDAKGSKTERHCHQFYPGDDCVDIIGLDFYRPNPKAFVANTLFINEFASSRGKLLAMTEYGVHNPPISPDSDFHSNWLEFFSNFNFCYVHAWSGNYFLPNSYPSKTHTDFVENFAPSVLFREDVQWAESGEIPQEPPKEQPPWDIKIEGNQIAITLFEKVIKNQEQILTQLNQILGELPD